MQPNTITLDVDLLNDGNDTATPYERFEVFANRSVYIGANHMPEARDTISMYRSFPTKSGNFQGVQKTAVKFSKDYDVPGVDGISNITAPVIIEISISAPVGITVAQLVAERQRALALLDLDSVMTPLNSQGMI